MHRAHSPHFLLPSLWIAWLGLALPALGDVTVGGDRPVRIEVPTSYDPDIPTPLIIELHPYINFSGFSFWSLDSVVESEGVLFAKPLGRQNPAGYYYWDATDACCANLGGGIPVDDSSYLRNVIEQASAELNVDADRIYVLGQSNGGFMAHRLACDHPDLIAAAVSKAGATWQDPSRCAPGSPVHVLQIHGTADTNVPLGGGVFAGTRFPGAVETVRRWATLNGCALVPEMGVAIDVDAALPGNETTVTRYPSGCEPGGSAELWTMQGASHLDSGGPAVGRKILDWLFAHPKREAPAASFSVQPADGTAPLECVLDAGSSTVPEGTQPAVHLWSFGDGQRGEGVVVDHTFREPGRHLVSLTLITEDGRVSRPGSHIVRVLCPVGDPAPWTTSQVGSPIFPGAADLESVDGTDVLEVCAGGADLGSTNDQHFFVYQEVTGNFRLTARVDDLRSPATAAKLGVMIRGSLAEDAAFAGTFLETAATRPFWRFRHRPASGERQQRGDSARTELPTGWIRIERNGATISSLFSEDGEDWVLLGEEEVALPETVLVGVAATGRDPGSESLPFEPLRARISNLELVSFGTFVRGNCNGDGAIDISDPISTFRILFLGVSGPRCVDACDSNDDGMLDLTDPVHTLEFLFLGRGEIPHPGSRNCGKDLTDDTLTCDSYDLCP